MASLNIQQNKTIKKIEKLIDCLVLDDFDNQSMKSQATNQSNTIASSNLSQLNLSYAELLALYEKEKNSCLELETSLTQKSKESNKNIENLNKEMNNLATIIDDLRKQYLNMQK